MATDENKALLRRFIELWSTGNVALADEFVSADLLDHTLLPGLPPGLAGFKLMVRGFRAAFPDLRVTIDDLLAEGDKAAARVTFRGTQRGEFQDIPPSGKSITMSAIALLRFEDGAVPAGCGQGHGGGGGQVPVEQCPDHAPVLPCAGCASFKPLGDGVRGESLLEQPVHLPDPG